MFKKIFFLSLFLFSIFNLFSQNYEPTIKEGSFWDIKESGSGFCSFYSRYQISGDTIFNSITYKKLKVAPIRSDYSSDLCIGQGNLYVNENDFVTILQFYIREDLIGKRIYILTTENPNIHNEYLLADYNLDVGDTLNNAHGIDMKVSKISVSSDGRKKYYLDNQQYYEEGRGSSLGPVLPYNMDLSDSTFDISCWGNTQNQNNCTEVLSTKKYSLSSIKTFPNPVKDVLTIKNTENITVKIFSVTGSLLKTVKSKTDLEMDISSFKNGVYILEIYHSTGKKTSRILKH